jgi:site-specific recombinase XerD
MKSTKGRTFPPESYTRDECLALLDACGTSAYGVRNQALIALLWRAGLRLAEALALRATDIDADGRVRVLHGKGDKARTTMLDERGLAVVQTWLVARQAWALPTNTPIICTRDGAPLKQSYVRKLLPRLARKAGVHKRVHAHGFRHTFAVDLLRNNVPVSHIQRLLGHSSLQTTAIYLASLSPEESLDYVRKRTEW